MSELKSRSVPEKTSGFTVAASPLNPVKFELGIILFIALFLLVVIPTVVNSTFYQFAILVAYGLIAMAWLIVRTRRLINKNLNDLAKNER